MTKPKTDRMQSVPAARAELEVHSRVLWGIIRSLQQKVGLSEEVFALKLMAQELETLPARRLLKTVNRPKRGRKATPEPAPNGPADWVGELERATGPMDVKLGQ